MSANQPRFALPLLAAIALVSVGTLAFRSGATSMRSAPTVAPLIAVVNVETLVNQAAETEARNAANDNKYKGDIDELKKMEGRAEGLRTEAKALKPDDRAGLLNLRMQLAELEGRYKAKGEFLAATRDEEFAGILREVYTKALATIEQYAKQHNIALVIMDDSSMPLPKNNSMSSMNSSIVQRQMLYVDKSTLDITNDILAKMNNDYTAAGGKPAARSNR